MDEFIRILLSSFEVFGVSIPLLWLIAGAIMAVAVAVRAWSSMGVAALLVGLSYLAPFVKH